MEWRSQRSNIGRDVDQNLQTGCNSPAQPGVGPIERAATVALAEIYAVLVLEAALRHHHTRVRYIGPIRINRTILLRTLIGGGRRSANSRKRQADQCYNAGNRIQQNLPLGSFTVLKGAHDGTTGYLNA